MTESKDNKFLTIMNNSKINYVDQEIYYFAFQLKLKYIYNNYLKLKLTLNFRFSLAIPDDNTHNGNDNHKGNNTSSDDFNIFCDFCIVSLRWDT